jgi:hypothetical protein
MADNAITLSIVSHGQNTLVNQLLEDVERHCKGHVESIVTQNIDDAAPLARATSTVRNITRKGFGANHNAAFQHCSTPYYCVCNPDIRLESDPFPALLAALRNEDAAVAGPLVRSPLGALEDSARHFPTAARLLRKALSPPAGPECPTDRGAVVVDWVAGMFMLFRSEAYREIGGFDEAYFLYYEDVDICRRLHAAGRRVIYEPRSVVIHDAQRASRRNAALALQHARSGLRYLLTR